MVLESGSELGNMVYILIGMAIAIAGLLWIAVYEAKRLESANVRIDSLFCIVEDLLEYKHEAELRFENIDGRIGKIAQRGL